VADTRYSDDVHNIVENSSFFSLIAMALARICSYVGLGIKLLLQ